MSGRVISQSKAQPGTSIVDISRIAAGTYTIMLADEEANTYEGQKFVKL
jgi:hypothetical protein